MVYGITKRGLCHCGKMVRSKGRADSGNQIWDKLCWTCRGNSYRIHKKLHCESCGFIALHAVQLDVDHIDGNRANNDIDNLQTLCANCHRLKTHINEDHLRR
jgi:5-methylcytosine-specific restriction endonuclease McrA